MDEKIQFIIELLKQGDSKDAVQDLQNVTAAARTATDAYKDLASQAQAAQTAMANSAKKSGSNPSSTVAVKSSRSQSSDAATSSPADNTQPSKEDIAAGKTLSQKLPFANKSTWDQKVGQADLDYEKQKQQVDAYYANEIKQAEGSKEKIDEIYAAREESFNQLVEQHDKATSKAYQDLQQIENYAATNLASGLTTAFTSIIQGTKSAGQAFEEFAAKFLEQVAEMIMQTIILSTIKSIAGLQDGGVAVGGGTTKNADGGIHFAAAHGIMLAAAGVAGVSQVNSPTIFPKFNVMAGEAGSEMLTVLAKPQTVDVNGQPAVMGNVGPHRLAIMSQESLSAMVNQPRLMADGGMAGLVDGSGGGNTGLKVSSVAPQTDGRIVVELTPHPAYEQRVVQNSIAGARVQIASDLNTDTPIRRNAQGILG